ncbi:MAG: family 20 glycosylhydrolase, partial [Clostridia bacterium]
MIIPKPSKEQLYNSKFILTARSNLFCSPELQEVGQLFQEYAEISLGERLPMVNSIEEAQVCFCYVDYLEGEKYVLNIGESVLTVDATTCAGAFYAVMSLRQLLDMDTTKGAELSCATMSISDEPQYQYRGLLLDIARHFFGKEDICRIIDLISAMKLNILHLHLTDDQGFRIQIDKYPKINEISSYRNGTLTRENGNSELVKERYGGYLTKDEIREIVSYAKSRYVTIIPEIDLPGHMSAVISAYPELSCTGKQIDVRERWGISKDILCAGNPDIYPFVKDILDEVCELFPSAY